MNPEDSGCDSWWGHYAIDLSQIPSDTFLCKCSTLHMRASFWDQELVASMHFSEVAFPFPFIKSPRPQTEPHRAAASAVLTALPVGRASFHALISGHAAILQSQVHQFKNM